MDAGDRVTPGAVTEESSKLLKPLDPGLRRNDSARYLEWRLPSMANSDLLNQFTGTFEYGLKHRGCEAFCIRVVTTAVIGIDEGNSVG